MAHLYLANVAHPLRALAGLALLLGAVAVGCSSDTGDVASTDQFSGEVETACSAEEIDPLVACSAEPCEGMSGDPLMACMDDNCPETVWEGITETCANCMLANQYSVEAMAQGCGPAGPPPTAACSPTEIDPLVACSAEPCEGMSGDPLMACMDDNCPETVWEGITETCANCMLANQFNVEAMAAACGQTPEAEPPTAACTADEIDPIAACATEPCAGMAGDPLMECMDVNCPETVWELSEACAQCMIANQSSIEAMIGTCSGNPAPSGG